MFSVIIPLYNKSDTIERAIRSVLAQTESAFELIVVDDGSKDDGAGKVKKFSDARIRLIQQPNGGVSVARNTGIAAAKYDYITFLDADDEYLPDFLATIKDLIRDFPQAGIWGSNYWYVYPNGDKEPPIIRGLAKDFRGIIPDYFAIAAKSAPIYCSISVCIQKTALQEIGGFPVGIRSGEDLLTWARICAKYPAAYDNSPCVVYNLGETAGYLPTRVPQAGNYVGKELVKLWKNYKIPALRKYIAFWQKNRISCFTRLNMRKDALRDCCMALRYEPLNWKIYIYLFLNMLPQSITHYLLTHLK